MGWPYALNRVFVFIRHGPPWRDGGWKMRAVLGLDINFSGGAGSENAFDGLAPCGTPAPLPAQIRPLPPAAARLARRSGRARGFWLKARGVIRT